MNALRQSGYTLLSLPKADVLPLALLLKTSSGVVEKLNSNIKTLFKPTTKLPPALSKDVPLPSGLSNMENLDVKAEADVSFIKGLFKVFSGSGSAGFSLENKENVSLKLNNAKSRFIDIVKLDEFIQTSELNSDAKGIVERLKHDDLYVVTEIIKANNFTLEENNNTAIGAKAEVNATGILNANTEFNMQKEKKKQIQNLDDTYYTIAIKAYRILYDKPSLFSNRPAGFRIREANDIKHFKGGEENYPAVLLENELIELSDVTV